MDPHTSRMPGLRRSGSFGAGTCGSRSHRGSRDNLVRGGSLRCVIEGRLIFV